MRTRHDLDEVLAAVGRLESLLEAIKCALVHGSPERAVTQRDLDCTERKIMSAISDFAAKQAAFNDRQGAAVDSAVASLQGLTEDVKTLNDKIEELQNSPGGVTPEDQALINDLEAKGDALTTKVEAFSTALKGLDDLTPPKPPVA